MASLEILRRILSDFTAEQVDDQEAVLNGGESIGETAAEPMAVDPPTIPEQVPYVPSEARVTKEKARKDKNAVVQVAKASGSKKRKSKAEAKTEQPADTTKSETADTNSPAPPSKKAKRTPVKAEDIPEFDYSQEPNQLDTFEASSTSKDKRKKPKKSKQRKPPFLVWDFSFSDHSIVQ